MGDATHRAARLEEIMAEMAKGDHAFAVTLFQEFGDEVKGAVRRAFRQQGRPKIDEDTVGGIALDVCFDLVARAPSWDPGGAKPWNWGYGLVVGHVRDHLGPVGACPLGTTDLAAPAADPAFAGHDDGDVVATLTRLAASGPLVALLQAGLARACGPRDSAVLLELHIQKAQGDPSPSHTVARAHAMTPAAVRKAASRTAQRLRRLARAEPDFAALEGLAILQGDPTGEAAA